VWTGWHKCDWAGWECDFGFDWAWHMCDWAGQQGAAGPQV